MDEVVLLAGRIVTGLLAGVYLAFLVAVMPALHGLSDEVFAAVFNRISVVIVNPAFLSLFLGAPGARSCVAAVAARTARDRSSSPGGDSPRDHHRRERAAQRRTRRRRIPP